MPVRIKDGRTVEKVRFIISLLDIQFEYKCVRNGYEFTANGISIKLATTLLWRKTANDLAHHIKELYIKEVFLNANRIDHLEGAQYILAHRQRNEDYIRYLETAS